MSNAVTRRLGEPSTHAGLAVGLAVASAVFPQYALILQGLAALFAGGAVVTPEKGNVPQVRD